MQTIEIHQIGPDQYYTGQSEDIKLTDPAPKGWTRSALPALTEGEYARWTGTNWQVSSPPSEAKEVEPTPPRPPQSCTPAQGLMALYVLKGITEDDILASIATIEDEAMRYQALISYRKATVWERVSMTMQVVAQLKALTEPDLDELFTKAATYTNL